MNFELNHQENLVPTYVLPDALETLDGDRVQDAKTWEKVRRPEILGLFEDHIYGKTPTGPFGNVWKLSQEDNQALGGLATRRELTLNLGRDESGPQATLLLYLPNRQIEVGSGCRVMLGLNFCGNHAIHADESITINPATAEIPRGESASRWPLEMILELGFGVATAFYGDFDPDTDDFSNGIHPYFYEPGQTQPGPGEWGAIGAWAWGLSRMLDYLETDAQVEPSKVTVLGHSRLGKAALWAGAQDPRFAIVISNNSGCGGAALFKRCFGETVARINTFFPHWFCANFKAYNHKEAQLPVDQHQLLALMAPRPVYVASATLDLHADPRGEYLAVVATEPVYQLYGCSGPGTTEMPPADTPVGMILSYHLRTGEHDITAWDWASFLDFAELEL